MTAYCSSCGNALPPAARFCSACGTAVAGFANAGFSPTGFPAYVPRLVRPLFGRQIAGVCAALARAYGWDIGLLRGLAVVAGIFLCPIPEIAYVAFWIGLPEEPVAATPLGQMPNVPPQP